ncbi:MAG TPA: PAS domain S-box protein [Thermoguttaceae bacterium]|nr:PAS domain S-box protein [Thermoguttaceae bacterium]
MSVDDPKREHDALRAELADARARLATLEADCAARQKSLDEAVEAGRRSFREIFNGVVTAIGIHEIPTGRILDANQAMFDLFGCSREEVLDPSFWEKVTLDPPYDTAAAVALLNEVAKGDSRTVQWPVRRRNGEKFWIEAVLKRSVIGGTPCVVSLSTDITKRRLAEESLAESQRKLSNAVTIAKLGYWEYDVANNLFTFDDHFYAIFHTTAEKVGGYKMSPDRYASLFVPPDDAHKVADEIRLAIEAQEPSFNRYVEHRILRADGTTGYIAVHYFVVKDEQGRTVKTYGANQDITDRKLAEEALKASEENYREIFNATMNAIFVHEIPTGRILDVNQTMLEMFGMTREEALASTVEELSAGCPDFTQKEAVGLINKAATNGPRKFEWHSRGKNGRTFWAEVTLRRAMIGGVPRVLALVNDITDWKKARERLIEEQHTLRQLLEAQERERRLIAYEIHDGVAQQLAAAAMYCSAFEQLSQSDPQQAMESHETGVIMLQKALAETRRLIRGLRPVVLDESGLVAAIENLCSDLREREGIEIAYLHEVHFDRLDPAVENSLFRIVQESLTNAGRYSGTKKILVRLVQEADRLIVEIQDWGRGFDVSKVDAERFGLKGIRERASLLGGRATVESAPGSGTRIRVEMPLDGIQA